MSRLSSCMVISNTFIREKFSTLFLHDSKYYLKFEHVFDGTLNLHQSCSQLLEEMGVQRANHWNSLLWIGVNLDFIVKSGSKFCGLWLKRAGSRNPSPTCGYSLIHAEWMFHLIFEQFTDIIIPPFACWQQILIRQAVSFISEPVSINLVLKWECGSLVRKWHLPNIYCQ